MKRTHYVITPNRIKWVLSHLTHAEFEEIDDGVKGYHHCVIVLLFQPKSLLSYAIIFSSVQTIRSNLQSYLTLPSIHLVGNAFDYVALIKYSKNLYCYSCNFMQCACIWRIMKCDKLGGRTLIPKNQQPYLVQFVLFMILKGHIVVCTFFWTSCVTSCDKNSENEYHHELTRLLFEYVTVGKVFALTL